MITLILIIDYSYDSTVIMIVIDYNYDIIDYKHDYSVYHLNIWLSQ